MTQPDPFQPRLEQLPLTLPVFPLPGVILLPHARLPLNIFEPRYLAMIEDALGAGRLVGMVQPSDMIARSTGAPALRHPNAPDDLYHIGCVGRISSFSETSDGRMLATLVGVCRFEIVEEIRTLRGYRRIKPDWQHFVDDFNPPAESGETGLDRKKLLSLLRPYFAQAGINADWDLIAQSEDPDLVDSLTMICPFNANEKQALLEAKDTAARGKMILTLLEMSSLKSGAGDNARH